MSSLSLRDLSDSARPERVKSHDLLATLVGRGYATVITPGALHRGRLHVQYKPLYEAIGQPKQPASHAAQS